MSSTAVPVVLTDLSVAEGDNHPPDTWTITASTRPSDNLRALGALLRREQAQFTAVASASSIDLGAITTGNYGHVTGTTTITSFGTVDAGIERTLVFDGILTLTHNATSLILATGANRTTAAGDVAVFVSEGSGNWREKAYHTSASYQAADPQLDTLAGISAQQATDLASLSTFMGTVLNDANQAAALTTLGSVLNAVSAKTAGYTVVAGDRGKLIDYTTAGYDLTLDVAMGTAFFIAVRNSASSGNVTLKSTATIDGVAGATGIALAPGESCFVGYDGAAWKTVCRSVVVGVGVGQTWQDVKVSRAITTNYTNSTGKPIAVSISVSIGSVTTTPVLLVDSVEVFGTGTANVSYVTTMTFFAIIPNGGVYQLKSGAGTVGIHSWTELR